MKNQSFLLPSGTFTKRKYNQILVASLLAWSVSLIDSCADVFIAGVFLNETAVSAISLVQPFSSIVSFLCYLFSVGTAVMYSRESGAFRKDKAYRIVGQGILCSAVVSVLLVTLMLVIEEPLMNFYGASEEILAMAKDYYMCEIFYASIFPYYFVLYQLVEIDGDSLLVFLASLLGALSNLFVSMILVGSYEVKGLAIGTIAGTLVAILVYLMHFLRKSNSIKIRFQFEPREILEIVKISSSTSMTLLYVGIIDIVMNKFVIDNFGDNYLPAYAVINFILNFGAVCASSYEAAFGFLSVAYGEKNPESIRTTMKIATKAVLAESLILFALFELLAGFMPSLFGIADPAVQSAAVTASRLIAFSAPATGLYYLYCSYYPAVGHVLMGHFLSILYMLITPLAVAIPLGKAFGFGGLSFGFMLTAIIADLLTAIVIGIKYGKRAVPMVLEEADEESLAYDFRLTKENINKLCLTVRDELDKRGIDAEYSNEVQMILEESYMTIMDSNPRKKVISECNILISDKGLRLITRDNGKIFDITDADARVKDLRSYVLARLMEKNPERTHVTTVSFNRNSYIWHFSE